jgi:pSer/pThr/pTyr-binding forkhead associated (FHA) protein
MLTVPSVAPQSTHPSVQPPAPPRADSAVPLEIVRDRSPRPDFSPSETVRFRRPVDDAVQLLPGHLEVLSGDPRHQEIRFVRLPGRPAELILGREPGDSPQHVVLRSSTVSRQHARLAYSDGRWAVENLSHTNPVIVNEEELSARDGQRPLADGDRLELGEVVLRFHAH